MNVSMVVGVYVGKLVEIKIMKKLENTLENKQKYFAQYWGQEVLKHLTNAVYYKITGSLMEKIYFEDFLELKPISQITDEELIEFVKLIELKRFYLAENNDIVIERAKNVITVSLKSFPLYVLLDCINDYNQFFVRNEHIQQYTSNPRAIIGIDYLRSKGYAMPFNDLSVQDLINYGWLKLKGIEAPIESTI